MPPNNKPAIEQYLGGEYKSRHPDWHSAESAGKAADLQAGLEAMLRDSPQEKWKITDVGAGVGGVLDETMKRMANIQPGVELEGCGIEISSQAIAMAAQRFPHLKMQEKFFEPSDGPIDAVMFVDVLEHVENPWELLRAARSAARYMLVRQPLLEGFSTFRHRNYQLQRQDWGHIGFFSYHFFLDMTAAAGWEPLRIDLRPPWELTGNSKRPGQLQKLFADLDRVTASFFISGFYLNGVFIAR